MFIQGAKMYEEYVKERKKIIYNNATVEDTNKDAQVAN